MKLTRKTVVTIFRELQKLSDVPNTKLAYFVMRNKKFMAKEIAEIQKLTQPSLEYMAVDTQRVDICKHYALKDEAGKPKVENNNFVFAEEGKKDLTKALEKLEADNKEVLEKEKQKSIVINQKLDEEIEIEVYTLDFDKLPSNLNANQIEILQPLIVP